jgi:hypothetical protein
VNAVDAPVSLKFGNQVQTGMTGGAVVFVMYSGLADATVGSQTLNYEMTVTYPSKYGGSNDVVTVGGTVEGL